MDTQNIDLYYVPSEKKASKPASLYVTSQKVIERNPEDEGNQNPFRTDYTYKNNMMLFSQLDLDKDIGLGSMKLNDTQDVPTPFNSKETKAELLKRNSQKSVMSQYVNSSSQSSVYRQTQTTNLTNVILEKLELVKKKKYMKNKL
jgi:hypothetical protein